MRLPNWLSWWFIRATMEVMAVRLWWRGMSWVEARHRVGEATKLYMHREVCDQFGTRPSVSQQGGGREDGKGRP